MATKTPLALVKEKFGDKAKLVAAVEKLTGDDLWVARTNKDKGLAHVSNAKLLRLHATFTEVKEKFGTREKLIDAILELEKRTKDAGLSPAPRGVAGAAPLRRVQVDRQASWRRRRRRQAAAKAAKKAAAKAPAAKPRRRRRARSRPRSARRRRLRRLTRSTRSSLFTNRTRRSG